jgi:hypothetical protein
MVVRDLKTRTDQRVAVGGVFIYVGFMPNSHIFDKGFKKDAGGFIITDEKMETHLPGVYVAGDVRSQYVRQISNAVGDATTAAVAATRYRRSRRHGKPEERKPSNARSRPESTPPPIEYTTVARRDVPPGQRLVMAGDCRYALANVDGTLHALDNNRPHTAVRLVAAPSRAPS